MKTTTTCTHPADKARAETLLMTCPDCGAECSGTRIGDDQLCYDQACPLHVMAGEIESTTIVEEVHVTRVQDGGVYGHTTDHCNESGCNGDEQYFSELDGEEYERGDLASVERDATPEDLDLVAKGAAAGRAFFEEFGEVLDAAETDWDWEAFVIDFPTRAPAEGDRFRIYQRALIAETERLVGFLSPSARSPQGEEVARG